MKLQYQLNAAFTTLLLVILTVTGIIIYSLILNLLIHDEQRQLEQKGKLLVNILSESYLTRDQFNEFLQEQDLQLFVYDKNQHQILFSTMPQRMTQGFFLNNDFKDKEQTLWEYGNDKFVHSTILIYPPERGLEMILLTPLSDLENVRHHFFRSLLVVFFIGTVVAVLLSYLLTNKLVTPLSRLKRQLKKIEKRQFDQVERVQATGEIKEVEQSVYEMASELQRYINSQQTFFQNASHELKTPLMTIQGYAEGIRDGIFTQAEKDKGLEVMVQEVKRLKKIINEMILLAKLDSEQAVYNLEKIRVNSLIDQVITRTMPLVNEKGLEIRQNIDDDLYLYVDVEKMLQALLNIMMNAIRHAKGIVKITVLKQNSKIVIIIEDDGDGIEQKLIPHIFHRFVKGKSGETGLGLAIARAIIEQSGGKIAVMPSEELGGAKFTLTFIARKKQK